MSISEYNFVVLQNEIREVQVAVLNMDNRIKYLVPVVSLTSILVGAIFGILLLPPVFKCLEWIF